MTANIVFFSGAQLKRKWIFIFKFRFFFVQLIFFAVFVFNLLNLNSSSFDRNEGRRGEKKQVGDNLKHLIWGEFEYLSYSPVFACAAGQIEVACNSNTENSFSSLSVDEQIRLKRRDFDLFTRKKKLKQLNRS